ncbi:MAG TPA: hypothetical protein VEL76_32765 [Gemmataceae bacterium]|nr:hypothetical protein [Gemmataceae bacterium]
MEAVVSLPTLEELRRHVLATLCTHDHLDPQQTPLFQALVTRRGKPCGLFFQVQGPRMLKTYAIWTGEENRILFYDAAGMRFAESRLSDGPDPLQVAPRKAAA